MKQYAGIEAHVLTGVKTRLRVDPKVVVSSRLLQLQQQELDQAIDQELSENPALERVDPEPDGEFELDAIRKFLQQRNSAERFEPYETLDSQAGAGDWLDFVPAPTSLHDHLTAQLLPMVEKEDEDLARHLVDCVNDNGYLDIPVEEIALLAGASLERTRDLVKRLQACDPAGVGAHNLQECLSLQLSDEPDEISMLARQIVVNHWEALLKRHPKGIARKYGVSRTDVEAAFERIATLCPYPGESFVQESLILRPQSRSVAPDVIYTKDDNGVWIEVLGCDPGDFLVNKTYLDRYRMLRAGHLPVDTKEKSHVNEFVGRAMIFIRAIHMRRRTLRKIAEYLLKEQYGFVTSGSYEFLKPMTRLRLARETGMHESTVSRATMNKYVQILNGEVVAFEVFFKPALRVQKMIEEILTTENPSSPMPDRVIAEMLAERGVHVARRTVSKYREQLRTLASHRRRSA